MKLYISTILVGALGAALLYAAINYSFVFYYFFGSCLFVFLLLLGASIMSFTKSATYYEIRELTKKKYRYNIKKQYHDQCR